MKKKKGLPQTFVGDACVFLSFTVKQNQQLNKTITMNLTEKEVRKKKRWRSVCLFVFLFFSIKKIRYLSWLKNSEIY